MSIHFLYFIKIWPHARWLLNNSGSSNPRASIKVIYSFFSSTWRHSTSYVCHWPTCPPCESFRSLSPITRESVYISDQHGKCFSYLLQGVNGEETTSGTESRRSYKCWKWHLKSSHLFNTGFSLWTWMSYFTLFYKPSFSSVKIQLLTLKLCPLSL